MTRRPGKKVLAGAAALALLAGGGAAIAASQLGGSEDQQAIVQDAAKRLGVEPEQLSSALQDAYETRVDQAVTSGRMTKEQGDELKQRVESGELPLVGAPLDRGGFRHDGGPLGGPGGALEAAATYLGLDQPTLLEKLRAGSSLADVAKEQGKTTDGLKQAIVDAAKAQLAQAVADGRLTQAQADEAQARLETRVDDLIAGTGLGRGPGRGLGPGHGDRGHDGPMGHHGRHHGGGPGLDAAASYLGLTEAELADRLRSGSSLAEIAKAQGKTADGLKQALSAAAKEHLDEEVQEGDLTQEQADAMLEQLRSRLDDVIAGTGFGPRGRHGERGDMPAPSTPGSGPTSPNADASL